MIPLFVDCSGRRIVIFGGGAVAARKAAYFANEAQVTVVSRSFVNKITSLPVRTKSMDLGRVSDEKLTSLIGDAFLVIGALSDPALNNRIGRLCRKEKILFNNADGDRGSVLLPAISTGENYTLAISTGGSSPAISQFIRKHLESELPELDAMAGLQKKLRQELKNREPDQARRNTVLHRVLEDPSIWKALKKSPDTALELAEGKYLHD